MSFCWRKIELFIVAADRGRHEQDKQIMIRATLNKKGAFENAKNR